MLLRFMSFVGLLAMIVLAWALSENRRRVDWRLVAWGVGLQLIFGVLLLTTPLEDVVFAGMRGAVNVLNDAAHEGASFVFGFLADEHIIKQDALIGADGDLVMQATFAFRVLPVIILVSAVSAILYHLRIIQVVVHGIAWVMRRTLKTSGAETFVAALLIFLGMESATAVRGYSEGI